MNQRGIATLTTAVVVLIITTLMVMFAARVSIFDQRMSGNEIRYKEAFAQADAGLDFAMERFARAFRAAEDPWGTLPDIIDAASVPTLTTVDGTAAGTVEAGFTVIVEDPGDGSFLFRSTGEGADRTGTAVVFRQAAMVHVLAGGVGPDVPIIVSGLVPPGGNFSIVANPNAGGPGVPVSVWSDGDIDIGGSMATCHQEFYQGGQCANPSPTGQWENITTTPPGGSGPIVDYDASMPDLLPNDDNFPDDLFRFIFGVERVDWAVIRDEAATYGQLAENCGAIAAAGTDAGANFPLWWVTGDCSFTGGAVIGSEERPVILVVDDRELSMTGGGAFFGIVFAFDNPDGDDTVKPSLKFGGGVEIFGSLISDIDDPQMTGNFSVVYSPGVLDSFSGETGGGINFTMARIPGSWRDFDF